MLERSYHCWATEGWVGLAVLAAGVSMLGYNRVEVDRAQVGPRHREDNLPDHRRRWTAAARHSILRKK